MASARGRSSATASASGFGLLSGDAVATRGRKKRIALLGFIFFSSDDLSTDGCSFENEEKL